MQTASDNYEDRLLPMTAEEFYKVRHRLAVITDVLRNGANGGPVSTVEMEEMWLEMMGAMVVLETAWAGRRANLRVVK